MPRILIAALVFLLGFTLYVMAVVALADHVTSPWPLQFAYFVVAGTLWVVPTRWLMLWAAGPR